MIEKLKEYVVWETEEVPHCLVLDQLEGVDLDVELRKGVSCKKSFPRRAVFTADPEFAHDLGLADTFDNTQSLVLASQKLADFIQSWKPSKVEFLPVTVVNPKRKPAGKYFIVHPIEPVDALNPKASGARWRHSEWIDRVKKLVLDEKKIERSRLLFKLRYFYRCVLIRRDLAEAITKQGFTGIKWTECENYKSI